MKASEIVMVIFYFTIALFAMTVFVYRGMTYDWIMHPLFAMGTIGTFIISLWAACFIIWINKKLTYGNDKS